MRPVARRAPLFEPRERLFTTALAAVLIAAAQAVRGRLHGRRFQCERNFVYEVPRRLTGSVVCTYAQPTRLRLHSRPRAVRLHASRRGRRSSHRTRDEVIRRALSSTRPTLAWAANHRVYFPTGENWPRGSFMMVYGACTCVQTSRQSSALTLSVRCRARVPS